MNKTYQFDPDVACSLGVNAAILIYNLDWWITKNKVDGRNYFDGRYWTYNTAKGYAKLFPFWNEDTIRKLLAKLEKDGVLISGNYNEDKRDRMKWYTINYESGLIRENFPLAFGKNAECTPIINNTVNKHTFTPLRSPQGDAAGSEISDSANAGLFAAEEKGKNPTSSSLTKKDRNLKARPAGFQPPTKSEVRAYFAEHFPENPALCIDFYTFYDKNGWKVNRKGLLVQMSNWKLTAQTWIKKRRDEG